MDSRCGTLFIDDDCVVVRKRNDKSIRYYGGFEYIDDEFRIEFGDYVIYTSDHDRVQRCIENYHESKSEQ